MNIREHFDSHIYGTISVCTKTGCFKVGKKELGLTTGNANIIAIFIDLANNDQKRASTKTMTELSGAVSESSFKTRLSLLRIKLREFEIIGDVTANSLFLSDRLVGKIDFIEKDKGLEKKPYHFNVELADKLSSEEPSSLINIGDIRTKARVTIGRLEETGKFHKGLGHS